MPNILKLYTFYFSIILINSILSLFTDIPEIKDIEGNILKNFSLNAGESKTLNLTCNKNRSNYVSFLSLDNLEFNLESIKPELNSKNTTFSEIVVKDFNESDLLVNVNSQNDNRIEIINIINNDHSSYFEISSEGKTYIDNSYNFLKFINNNNSLKIEIKFKKKYTGKLHYGIVHLASKNISYIPRVFNFQNGIEQKKEKALKKEMFFEVKDIELDKNGNKNYTAFICSIETNDTIIKYSVSINNEKINYYLISSIVPAFIYAVITFFCIRRKQNITKHAEDYFYGQNTEEEEEKEKEN